MRKISVGQINPAKYNPRKDLQPGDVEYEKLLRSVEEFGYVEPIIWNERTGNIVGGHQRFKVLTQIGYVEIDCVVVDLEQQREKALNIALNKISGEFDTPKLVELLRELQETGFDVEFTGFETAEMDKMYQAYERMIGGAVEDNFDAGAAVDAIDEPLTRPGDIWLLGKHRLMCGDSTDTGAVAKLMDRAKARLLFTDPPWNVDYGGREHPSWRRRHILNDKMTTEQFGEFLRSAFQAGASVCEPGAMVYVVMSAAMWGTLMTAMPDSGYHWSSTIIWVKDSQVLSRKDYHTRYEPIWYGWVQGEKRLCPLQDRQQNDVWEIERPKKSAEHPTMKPVALVGRAINNSSHANDGVLDLFGGSGTTLIACEQAGRINYSMELDPKFCDVIVKRYIEFVKSDGGVFLLRDNQRLAYNEVE